MARGYNDGESNSQNPFAKLQRIVVELDAKTVAADNTTAITPKFNYWLVTSGGYKLIPAEKTADFNSRIGGKLLSFSTSYKESGDFVFYNLVFRFAALNDNQLTVDGDELEEKGVTYEVKMNLNTMSQQAVKRLLNLKKDNYGDVILQIVSSTDDDGQPSHGLAVYQDGELLKFAIGYPTNLEGVVNENVKNTDRNQGFCKDVLDFKIDPTLKVKEKNKLKADKKERVIKYFFGEVETDKPITDCFCADLTEQIKEYNKGLLVNVFGVELVDTVKDGKPSMKYQKINVETEATTATTATTNTVNTDVDADAVQNTEGDVNPNVDGGNDLPF